MTNEPWLWNREGEPDPEVTQLESELARHRWSGRLQPGPLPVRAAWRGWRTLAAAALLVGLLGGGLWWWTARGSAGSSAPAAPVASAPARPAPATPAAPAAPDEAMVYRAEALSGVLAADRFSPGERLLTDGATRARLHIGEIGSLVVEPGTSLRVERPGPALAADAEHLLWLERGAITASIFAAPRLFQLGTPSGLAVDLGCVYTARVEDDGSTLLSVRTGQVSFETPERRVIVPSGANAHAWPAAGPGTPVWDDAPPAYRADVARLDALLLPTAGGVAAQAAVAAALDGVLADRDERNTLTLWHLLAWPALPSSQRARVADALASLSPPPPGVAPEACVALDADALNGWRADLGWSW